MIIDFDKGKGGSSAVNSVNGQTGNVVLKNSDLENDTNYAYQTDINRIDEKIKDIELFKFPNVTIFGTPTIQSGQVSNFSVSNYLQFPFVVDFKNRPFVIDFAVTTGSDISGQQNILDSNYGLAVAVKNGQFVAVGSENGSSWTTSEIGTPIGYVEPDTTYYFRVQWSQENGRLEFGVSKTKGEFDTMYSDVMTVSPYPKTMLIGKNYANTNYFKGSINLNDAQVTISGKVIWNGMDDAGLATRAAVDLSNIDEQGEKRIEEITNSSHYTKTEIDAMIGDVENTLKTI